MRVRSLYGIGRPSRGEAGSSQIVRSFEEYDRSCSTREARQPDRDPIFRSAAINAVQASILSYFVAGLMLVSGSACVLGPEDTGPVAQRPFQMRDLAKSDVDLVAEIHLREVLKQLRTLMVKLYKRNPREWQRTGKPSAEFAIERVFRGLRVPDFVELNGARGAQSIKPRVSGRLYR